MAKIAVAPRVGAWIEMFVLTSILALTSSLPAWERGLKSDVSDVKLDVEKVAPRVGAWIEINRFRSVGSGGLVAPRVGAWIEIRLHPFGIHSRQSLPAWERGWKY